MAGEELNHPLHRAHAQRLIRRIAEEGRVNFSGHARQRMGERDVTEDEVLHALRHGHVDDGKPDARNRWSYQVHWEGVGAAINIVSESYLRVATAWRRDA